MDTTTTTTAKVRRRPKNEECYHHFYSHRLRSVATLAVGQCQRGFGLTTLLSQHLRQLWADLPPEHADMLNECLSDAGQVATLLDQIKTRLESAIGTTTTGRDAA